MPKLNKNTYFSAKNKYLSNSKVKDFAKDKAYFFKKHILGDFVKPKKADPLIIGSAADLWLTSSEKDFREKYTIVSKRDSTALNYEYQLNPTMYQKVEDLCKIVKAQSAYKALKGHKTQKILQYDMPIGDHFIGLCGVPDWIKIKGTHAVITDLKTSNNVDPSKYFWTCVKFDYFQQLANYRKLTYLNFPEVETIDCQHLVVDSTNELHPVYTVKFTQTEIDKAEDILNQYIDLISIEKEFLPRNVSWDDAIMIGQSDEDL